MDNAPDYPQAIPPVSPTPKKNNIFLWLLLFVTLFVAGFGVSQFVQDWGWLPWSAAQVPTSFEECSKLKDSIIELSYPGTCVTKDGQRFTQVVSSPTPDPIANWKTYTNTKYHYAIKFPQSYKTTIKAPGIGLVDADEKSESLFLDSSDVSREPGIIIRAFEYPPQSYVFQDWKKSDVSINNVKTTKYESQDSTNRVTYIFENSAGDTFIEISTANISDQQLNIFDQILSTFKFTN